MCTFLGAASPAKIFSLFLWIYICGVVVVGTCDYKVLTYF